MRYEGPPECRNRWSALQGLKEYAVSTPQRMGKKLQRDYAHYGLEAVFVGKDYWNANYYAQYLKRRRKSWSQEEPQDAFTFETFSHLGDVVFDAGVVFFREDISYNNIVHELAHWVVATPMQRLMTNYGAGDDEENIACEAELAYHMLRGDDFDYRARQLSVYGVDEAIQRGKEFWRDLPDV